MSGSTNRSHAIPSAPIRNVLGALLMALALTACGSDNKTPAGPVIPPGTTTVSMSGGTVSAADGKLSMIMAANSLKGDTYFKIVPETTVDGLSDTYVLVAGTAYEIDWSGAGFADGAAVTLKFTDPATAQGQMVRMTAQGLKKIADVPTTAVVHCADGNHVYVIDTSTQGYSNASVVMCTPTTGPSPTGTTVVGIIQPAAGQFPTISTQPADASVTVGDTVTFSVTATAASGVSYQWQRDGVAITGATAASLSFIAAATDTGAKFSVIVSNSFGHLTSATATLTVGPSKPPAPPQFNLPTAVTPFAPGIDLPEVGVMAEVAILAWNNNGVLDSDDATIHSRALPTRGRPIVLAGPNMLTGYVVFLDDDGTSSCQVGTGNRLSAIAIGWDFDNGNYPPSDRFTVYLSAGDCISSFSAGLSPDASNRSAIAFAVQESSAATIKVGFAGATHARSVANGVAQITWTPTTPTVADLVTTTDCSKGYLTGDGMMGILQAQSPVIPSPTTAVLAYTDYTSAEFCAATLIGNSWSVGSMVFDNASYAEPVAAIDGNGNSLVLASRVIDNNAAVLSFAMMTGYMPTGVTVNPERIWGLQALDTSDGAALPSAAFHDAGNVLVTWRANSSSGTSTVYMTRRLAAGTWDPVQTISSPTAVETRYPRLCVGSQGRAIAVFEQNFSAGSPFAVFARGYANGLWSDFVQLQNDSNEGRFADCPRNANLTTYDLEVTWRETDPADASQFRVMSVLLESP